MLRYLFSFKKKSQESPSCIMYSKDGPEPVLISDTFVLLYTCSFRWFNAGLWTIFQSTGSLGVTTVVAFYSSFDHHVINRHITSFLLVSCHVLPPLVMSCLVSLCHVMSRLVVSLTSKPVFHFSMKFVFIFPREFSALIIVALQLFHLCFDPLFIRVFRPSILCIRVF